MQLRNISKHRPKRLIIDVEEKDAKEIMKTGEFVECTKEVHTFVKKEKEESKVKQDEEK